MPASPTVVPASNLRPTREGQLCPPNRSYMMPTSGQPAPSFPTPITSSQNTSEVLSLPAIESLPNTSKGSWLLGYSMLGIKKGPWSRGWPSAALEIRASGQTFFAFASVAGPIPKGYAVPFSLWQTSLLSLTPRNIKSECECLRVTWLWGDWICCNF